MGVKLKDGSEAKLELFKFNSCPFCIRVMLKIKLMGIQGIEMRDTRTDPGAQAELLRVGGDDQVPCLFIDGKPMYESADIVEWLEQNVAV